MLGIRKFMLAGALGLAGLMAIPAAAQYRYGYGQGQYDRSSSQAYQQGVRDGQWDNDHGPQNRNRYWRNPADAQAYRDGYNSAYRGNNAGNYRNGRRDRDWDHDRDRYRRGGWGNGNGGYGYGNGGYNNGGGYAQQGYIDGVNDGSHDRQTGHSFRPTEWAGYRHADRGYNGQGSKDQYKAAYRQAYMQGYQRGYYGGRR